MPKKMSSFRVWVVWVSLVLCLTGCVSTRGPRGGAAGEDPYAEYVWPPPPDEPRIRLTGVLRGREDVEAESRLGRKLLGASPQGPYDRLLKPFAVAFDPEGRILVTDSGTGALIRFDRKGGRLDVFGTRGAVRLKLPLGLDVSPEGAIFVADAGLRKVVEFDQEGTVEGLFGREGELTNPTDAALSPDGQRLYVADSKAHRIVVFDREGGSIVDTIGEPGDGEGQFAFPTSIDFGPDGDLFVVDQINSRVQMLTADGDYLDQFGGLGVGFGNFVRPKDISVDPQGLVYVTDNAYNNVQLFDSDFTLLTFVGEGGTGPGRFHGASGIAVQGDEFAVVEQLGRRVQTFEYIRARGASVDTAKVSSTASVPKPPPVPTATPTVQGEPVEAGAKTPTPAQAPPGPEPSAAAGEPAEAVPGREDAAALVERWRAAWEGQRLEDYLASYASDFVPARGLTRDAWRKLRSERLTRPASIEVKIESLAVTLLDPAKARAGFVQTYRSDRYTDRVRKTLELVVEDGEWRIQLERVDGTL